MVLPTFARQALAGEPITVYGTREQTRCFAHVADVVDDVVRLLEQPDATRGEVFNVGSDREVSINHLARLVKGAAGSRSSIVHVPYEEAYAEGFEDMKHRVPDVSKLERATGFRAYTPLEEIVDDVLENQRARGRTDSSLPNSARTRRDESDLGLSFHLGLSSSNVRSSSPAVFLTGATGFVGRHVIGRLIRGGGPGEERGKAPSLAALVRPTSPGEALRSVDVVLHLAAGTGLGTAEELHRVNVEGTRALLDTALEAGVSRFVYVSSIAASFDDLDRYPYGRSKREAEELVRESGIRYTIVRLTIVAGPGGGAGKGSGGSPGFPWCPSPGTVGRRSSQSRSVTWRTSSLA